MRTLIVGHDCDEKIVIADALSASQRAKSNAAIVVFEIEDDKIDSNTLNDAELPRDSSCIDVSWIYVAKSWPVKVRCIEKFDKIITVEDVQKLKEEIPQLSKEI